VEAEAAISEAQAVLQAAPRAAQTAAAEVLAQAQLSGLRVLVDTEDIVKSDGLAGMQHGRSNPAPTPQGMRLTVPLM